MFAESVDLVYGDAANLRLREDTRLDLRSTYRIPMMSPVRLLVGRETAST